ncbi:hypothetical protein GGI12_003402 [Dipsacomyces acuminosporus]|nr:hypothetical protein GGI12_003402 [Dipsacomyces acuminosporus]
MAGTELGPTSYIVIHERSPAMPILYASSSRRRVLLYEPSEYIGQSPLENVVDARDIEDMKSHHSSVTEDNVIMTNVFLKRKDGRPVYTRTISFACGDINFVLATAYPNIGYDPGQRVFSVQRFRCLLGGQNISEDGRAERRNLDANAMYSRKTAFQACMVLEELDLDAGSSVEVGPRVIFATHSISRIIEADSCDLQDLPFLSLIATRDIVKAATFLEKVFLGGEFVLERLHLKASPLEEWGLRGLGSVPVEFMGMGSDDGAILLCQLEVPKRARARCSGRPMSLEDIVTSDPDTSDFPERWNQVGLP